MQFSGPAPVRLFPPPETGEGEGGGEGRWRAQAVLLPPIPTFLRQGEGAEGPGIRSHASLGQHTLQGLLQHLPAELP